MNQNFRKIPKLKYLYEVNEDGIVRNVKSKKIIKPRINKEGYLQINIHIKDKPVTITIYELVADANDSVLKFYDLPDSSNKIDFATKHATNEIFNNIKNDVFAELKKTSVMDICNQINQKAYAD